MRVRASLQAVVVLVGLLPLTGCLFHTHRVSERISTAKLQSATRDELVARINSEAAKIQSLVATVDITPEVGGAKKGKIIEYHDITGYILVRKPSTIRMIGLVPIVRTRAFDMVSNGMTYELSIPPKNKFYVGHNDIIRPSPNQLENLRPQHILDALLLKEIDPNKDIAVLEGSMETVKDPKTHKDVQEPNYIVDVVSKSDTGWFLSRKIVFNREDLIPHEQIVYDKNGNVATDATYGNFEDMDGVPFPRVITITRPQEEYTIQLAIQKLKLNGPLKDEQFALSQPPGSQLVNMDQEPAQRAQQPTTPATPNKTPEE
jgi:uncharacterized protein DUF4292